MPADAPQKETGDPDARKRARRRKRWRRIVLGVVLGGLAAAWGCFPSPVRELWPPSADEARHRVVVTYGDWHTTVVLPPPGDAGPATAWEFCERAWYLEGKQGIGGVFRALFWPTESGISRRPVARGGPAADALEKGRWVYVVGDRGLERMRAWLEELRGRPLARYPHWYRGTRSYHLQRLCHHVTLGALRQAGLPVAPWWGYAGWMARIQLDRAARWHRDEGVTLERDEPGEPSGEG